MWILHWFYTGDRRQKDSARPRGGHPRPGSAQWAVCPGAPEMACAVFKNRRGQAKWFLREATLTRRRPPGDLWFCLFVYIFKFFLV